MANAVWYDLVTTVRIAVVNLGLTYQLQGTTTSLPAARVVTRKFPTDRGLSVFPAIVVAQGDHERWDLEDFEDTQVLYPVYVVHLFASNQDETPSNDELQWRQSILDMAVEFESTIRPNMPTAQPAYVADVTIDFQPALDRTLFQANLDVGALLLTFTTVRGRTR